MLITPDAKDWTWIVERPCPQCHFDATTLDLAGLPTLVPALAASWQRALHQTEVSIRPIADRWSTLQYAHHGLATLLAYTTRLRAMINADGAFFARPEAVLDEQVPVALSARRFFLNEEVDTAISTLHRDLTNGTSDTRHRQLHNVREYRGSLRLFVNHRTAV